MRQTTIVDDVRDRGVRGNRASQVGALPGRFVGATARLRGGRAEEVDTSRFVLLVDDDPDLVDVTSFVIENEGMAVETASNGEEALVVMNAGRLPAFVLLDRSEDARDERPEFLAAVANEPWFKRIPVVAVTAAEHAEIPGAREVPSKPMDLEALIRVVERYVRGDGGKDAGA